MSRETLPDALDEMFGLVSHGGQQPVQELADAGVRAVFDHEPGAKGVPKPCAVTLDPSAWLPTEWVIRVRIYVADIEPKAAQVLCMEAVAAVDQALKGGEAFGPSAWAGGWDDLLGCHLWWSDVQVGREDGF